MDDQGKTTTLLFDHQELQLLRCEAARLDITVGDLVRRHVKLLLDELEIADRLEFPEEAFMELAGHVADRMGAAALERTARVRGLRFEVVGGERHDGKKFGG